jgi:hypothetical protein
VAVSRLLGIERFFVIQTVRKMFLTCETQSREATQTVKRTHENNVKTKRATAGIRKQMTPKGTKRHLSVARMLKVEATVSHRTAHIMFVVNIPRSKVTSVERHRTMFHENTWSVVSHWLGGSATTSLAAGPETSAK